MQAVQIGPFSFGLPLFIFMVCWLAALLLAAWLDRRRGTGAESIVWRGVLLGAAAGRLGFLMQHWGDYAGLPLSWLDLRDGGFMPAAAVPAATLYWFWRVGRRRAAAVPVAGALSLALLAGGLLHLALGAKEGHGVEFPLSPLHTQTPPGREGDLSLYRGKLTVVNLWASWCAPCRREMPAFQQFQQAQPEVNVVFVNQQESAEIVQQYLDAEGLELRHVWRDPQGRLAEYSRSPGLPTTLFLDEAGRLLEVRAGEMSLASLKARVAGLR